MDWILGLPVQAQAMFVAVAGAPYLALVAGRLVPYRQVRDWKELYFSSEADRRRGIEAMERGADAIDATRRIVEAALGPIEKKARGEEVP